LDWARAALSSSGTAIQNPRAPVVYAGGMTGISFRCSSTDGLPHTARNRPSLPIGGPAFNSWGLPLRMGGAGAPPMVQVPGLCSSLLLHRMCEVDAVSRSQLDETSTSHQYDGHVMCDILYVPYAITKRHVVWSSFAGLSRTCRNRNATCGRRTSRARRRWRSLDPSDLARNDLGLYGWSHRLQESATALAVPAETQGRAASLTHPFWTIDGQPSSGAFWKPFQTLLLTCARNAFALSGSASL
jgi:hypothetical protein